MPGFHGNSIRVAVHIGIVKDALANIAQIRQQEITNFFFFWPEGIHSQFDVFSRQNVSKLPFRTLRFTVGDRPIFRMDLQIRTTFGLGWKGGFAKMVCSDFQWRKKSVLLEIPFYSIK